MLPVRVRTMLRERDAKWTMSGTPFGKNELCMIDAKFLWRLMPPLM